MTIKYLFTTVEINPYIVFATICAVVILYAIKRGYDHSDLELKRK